LANGSFHNFGDVNASELIQKFVQHKDSIGYAQKMKRRSLLGIKVGVQDPSSLRKILKDSYKSVLVRKNGCNENLKDIYGKYRK
jgi:hypothetical protein